MSQQAELDSLKINVQELYARVSKLEDETSILLTPPHRKLWFVLNGWALYRVVERPQWRPWRRRR